MGTLISALGLALLWIVSVSSASVTASATVPTTIDNSDSLSGDSLAVLAAGERRYPYLGIHLSLGFIDFGAKGLFESHLNALTLTQKMRVLQPYEKVHIGFPVGMVAGFPISQYFDIMGKSQAYWYRQTSLLGDSLRTNPDNWYAVQANLGGLGIKYYVPGEFLSVNDKRGLYIAYIHFWELGGSEIYSPLGSVRAVFQPQGTGFEIQAGFRHDVSSRILMMGDLGFTRLSFASDRTWRTLFPDRETGDIAKWPSISLQFSLNLMYQFGNLPKPVEAQKAFIPPLRQPEAVSR